jgi:hypothetical protein
LVSEFVKPLKLWDALLLRGVPSLDSAADIGLDTMDSAAVVTAWLRCTGLEQQ